MKSLRMKLFTGVSMFVVAFALLIVGVWAIGEAQTITMNGSVNFEIADKSLYVKDVRMQEDNNSTPYSLKEQGNFMPGYINGNFNMNLGNFTNTYGSFALYFDIINTTTKQWEVSGISISDELQQLNVSVQHSTELISTGTIADASQITEDTPINGTIILTIIAFDVATPIDLSGITVTLDEYVLNYSELGFIFSQTSNNNGELTSYTGTETGVVIPSSYSIVDGDYIAGDDYTVTSIASGYSSTSGAFSAVSATLRSVSLPNTLTSIGAYAFAGCGEITEITIPEGVKYIGDYAFSDCSNLVNVSIPNSIEVVGNYVFYKCDNLEYTIEEIDGNSGYYLGNSNNAYVYLSEFNWADDFDLSITINKNCKVIGSYIFMLTGRISSINIPEGVVSIGDGTFTECAQLSSLVLPSTLKYIGYKAFFGPSTTTYTFNTPYDWQVSSSETFDSYTTLTASSIQSNARTYLTATYCSYYWRAVS